MRVHHFNCGTLCPRSAQLVHGIGGWFKPGRLVCHCLLVETGAGLLLVDTGLGRRDVADPARRLGRVFTTLCAPKLDVQETAAAQVQALGFSLEDVQHIVVTHADPDHIGGIDDFPRATIHLHEQEYRAMTEPTWRERRRYRPMQWNAHTRFAWHRVDGERFEGFDAVRPIAGLDEVLLVPLVGHTRGHSGVAIRSTDGWLLHAGDAYFHRAQMDPYRPYVPPGLAAFQRATDTDHAARVHNQERLRRLRAERGTQISIICSHDPMEFDTRIKTATARAGLPLVPQGS